MGEQAPLSRVDAGRSVARCVVATAGLLVRRRVHLPRDRVGLRLSFADGTTGRVYRDTVLDRGPVVDPCLLAVSFRLHGVHGHGHALFRAESLLNTPLFVGFPGFVSKLWLSHDEREVYRGIYEWDGPALAEAYARSLWRVLALVSEPGSIRYDVVRGRTRRDLLDGDPRVGGSTGDWCRLVGVS